MSIIYIIDWATPHPLFLNNGHLLGDYLNLSCGDQFWRSIFFIKFFEDMIPFCRDTDTPVMVFLWLLSKSLPHTCKGIGGTRMGDILLHERMLNRLSYAGSANFGDELHSKGSCCNQTLN